MFNRKLRVRRDAEGEDNAIQTKSQNVNEVSKTSTNSGAAPPNISEVSSPESASSATSHKKQIIETHTMGSVKNNTDSVESVQWESVDRPDTVINKTFNTNLQKNKTWKVNNIFYWKNAYEN